MPSTRSRTKPNVVTTRTLPDGTIESVTQTWDEAYGAYGAAGQIFVEHNFLHNNILMKESDRAAAVLAPAYIDAILDDLLRAKLAKSKSTNSLLSEDKAPCGTFSAKIDLSHALGILKDDAWHDLHLLRKIRNDFAHSVDAHDFGYGPVLNRCKEFQLQNRWDSPTPVTDSRTARLRFLFVVWALVADIAGALRDAEAHPIAGA